MPIRKDDTEPGAGEAQCLWNVAPAVVALCPVEIHVWHADLAAPVGSGLDSGVLDASERERAARFRFDEDRRRFMASHAILRDILGRYLGIAPHEVALAEGPHGKPYIKANDSSPDIRFSMSHSGDVALYAVAAGSEVGVDIEFVREAVDCDGIAARFFSRGEAEAVHAATGDRKARAFFACWTRKEAIVKATGLGFSLPLESFSVAAATPGHADLSGKSPVRAGESDWVVRSLDAGRGYAAAVAFAREHAQIHFFGWSGSA